jgi:hypothetical protein
MAAMPQPLDEWQELLLVDLVEASRKLPEHEQTDFVVIEPPGTSGTCLLRHAGLEPGYATHPLHLVMLESWGFIQFTNEAPGIWSVVLLPEGIAYYPDIKRRGVRRPEPRRRDPKRRPDPRAVSPGDEDVIARCLEILDRPGLHFADRDNVMAAVTGYFQKNFDRPCPDSVAVWQRAIPHLVTASYMLEILHTDEFVDGSFGAWVKRAVTEWREGPGRGP